MNSKTIIDSAYLILCDSHNLLYIIFVLIYYKKLGNHGNVFITFINCLLFFFHYYNSNYLFIKKIILRYRFENYSIDNE